MTPEESNARDRFLTRLKAKIGEEAAVRFTVTYGGQNIYVPTPKRLKPSHRFVQLLGESAALELARNWGGNYLNVPNTASIQAKALKMARSGKSPAQIAQKLQRTPRHVKQILADLRKDGYTVRKPAPKKPKGHRPAKRERVQLDLLFDATTTTTNTKRK